MQEVFIKPFAPTAGASTRRATAATTTSTVAINNITTNADQLRPRKRDVLVTNKSTTETAYISFGDNTITATVPVAGGALGSMPILPGSQQVFECISATHAAVITEANTADLFFTIGEGV